MHDMSATDKESRRNSRRGSLNVLARPLVITGDERNFTKAIPEESVASRLFLDWLPRIHGGNLRIPTFQDHERVIRRIIVF